MQPNTHKPSLNYNGRPTRNNPAIKWTIVSSVVAIVIIVALTVMRANSFHVVNTTPALNKVGILSPDLTLNYNRELSSENVSVTSSPDVVSGTKVDGKNLILTLKNNMTTGTKYTITVVSVSSANGSQLQGKTYSFTAQDIPFNELSKEQQQTILDQQNNKPKTKDFSSSYFGESLLYDNGFTDDHVSDIEQALTNYFASVKITASTVTFSKPIPPQPHPDDPAAPDVYGFTVTFNDKSYSVRVTTSSISTARLYLYDATGTQQIYDSGDITPQDTSTCSSGGCQKAQ